MVQGKRDYSKHVALTRRCTACGETFPHVFVDDVCLNCGECAWEQPSARVREWSTRKGIPPRA